MKKSKRKNMPCIYRDDIQCPYLDALTMTFEKTCSECEYYGREKHTVKPPSIWIQVRQSSVGLVIPLIFIILGLSIFITGILNESSVCIVIGSIAMLVGFSWFGNLYYELQRKKK